MPRKNNVGVAAKQAAEPPAADTETPMDNDDSIVQPAGGASTPKEKAPRKSKGGEDETGIEDLMMPRTIVSRLAKGTIPPNFILSKDAVTAISKSATIFISHINAAAHEHTVDAKRVTVSPEDVFKALRDTEYGWMEERLREEYELHKSSQTAKRNEYRAKMKQNRVGVKDVDGEIEAENEGDVEGQDPEETELGNESTVVHDEVEENDDQDEEMEDEPTERVSKRAKIDVQPRDVRTSGRQRKISQKLREIEEESMIGKKTKEDVEDADEPEEEFQDAPEEISSEEEDEEPDEAEDEEEEPDEVERDEHDSAEESEGEHSD